MIVTFELTTETKMKVLVASGIRDSDPDLGFTLDASRDFKLKRFINTRYHRGGIL